MNSVAANFRRMMLVGVSATKKLSAEKIPAETFGPD